jgi:organic radical activating enzyme
MKGETPMYIQITTRCNMACSHCCFSCGKRGKDMTRETFVKACELAEERGDMIFIGGGEPTLHPLFWDFFGIAQRYNFDDGPIGLVTNGKRKDDALALARLAKQGTVYASLSTDKYHERIDPSVIQAFLKRTDRDNDLRDTRQARVVAQGRAAEWGKKVAPVLNCLSLLTGRFSAADAKQNNGEQLTRLIFLIILRLGSAKTNPLPCLLGLS